MDGQLFADQREGEGGRERERQREREREREAVVPQHVELSRPLEELDCDKDGRKRCNQRGRDAKPPTRFLSDSHDRHQDHRNKEDDVAHHHRSLQVMAI